MQQRQRRKEEYNGQPHKAEENALVAASGEQTDDASTPDVANVTMITNGDGEAATAAMTVGVAAQKGPWTRADSWAAPYRKVSLEERVHVQEQKQKQSRIAAATAATQSNGIDDGCGGERIPATSSASSLMVVEEIQ